MGIPFLTSRQVYKMNFSLTFVMLVLWPWPMRHLSQKPTSLRLPMRCRTGGREQLQTSPWLTLEQIMRAMEVAMIIGGTEIKCYRISILIMVESKIKTQYPATLCPLSNLLHNCFKETLYP